jgi:hypothetical protein
MPTEVALARLAALAATAGLILLIVLFARFSMPAGWEEAAHFVAFSALTFCLWQGTGGSRPIFVAGSLLVLAGLGMDAKDFVVGTCAVTATAGLLFMQRKPSCAESSPR